MQLDQSVSHWIASLREGGQSAAQKLWDRYRDRLVDLAQRRLAGVPKRAADEDDIAQSVFVSLCRGAAAGRLSDIRNRDELWWLLLAITRQKTIDLIRRETAKKRGAGRIRSEARAVGYGSSSSAVVLDNLIGDAPTPDAILVLEEESKRLLGLLSTDKLREIAVARIEGYSVAEIATKFELSARSIERKLQLIRSAWSKEISHAE